MLTSNIKDGKIEYDLDGYIYTQELAERAKYREFLVNMVKVAQTQLDAHDAENKKLGI